MEPRCLADRRFGLTLGRRFFRTWTKPSLDALGKRRARTRRFTHVGTLARGGGRGKTASIPTQNTRRLGATPSATTEPRRVTGWWPKRSSARVLEAHRKGGVCSQLDCS